MKKIKGNSKDFSRPLTHQVQADFEGFMRDNGLEPKQPLADIGQLGRQDERRLVYLVGE